MVFFASFVASSEKASVARLQCRREKFRRTRKLGVHAINELAACFGHGGLIDGFQTVQNAISRRLH